MKVLTIAAMGLFLAVAALSPSAQAIDPFPYHVGDVVQVQNMDNYQPVGPIYTATIARELQRPNEYLADLDNGVYPNQMTSFLIVNPADDSLTWTGDRQNGGFVWEATSSANILINGVVYNQYTNNQYLSLKISVS